jgi:hypothetical protein
MKGGSIWTMRGNTKPYFIEIENRIIAAMKGRGPFTTREASDTIGEDFRETQRTIMRSVRIKQVRRSSSRDRALYVVGECSS